MVSIRTFLLLALPALLLSCAVEVGPPHEELAADYKTSGDPALYTPRPPISKNMNVIVDVPAPPAPDRMWVGGFWAQSAWGWRWVPGRWVPLPRAGSVRVAGRFCRPWPLSD
ncbi:MAG: hypothetical protein EHM91_02430 [Planctomycetota bacterium]|nr:MAG: hypothetical protein EHM91_02430 [Planctomycetota bacterium]